jgi:putative aldouronate transport system permease protein
MEQNQSRTRGYWSHLAAQIWSQRLLYLMFLLPFAYFVVFRFYPMLGNVIAFKKYQFANGIWGSPWVGLDHFRSLFSDQMFMRALWNTVQIAFWRLLITFPAPIILALFLNEVHHMAYKRFIQTVVYVPYFLSWVIYAAILYIVLSPANGLINVLLASVGLDKVPFFQKPEFFQPLVIISSLLKETGWAAVIYLATISTIDPTLYEAAVMDGANRWKLMRHITLPGLATTIATLLILQIGYFLNVGFEQIFVMQNSIVLTTGDIIETYIYRVGVQRARFDFTTAAGLLNGIVGLVLVVGADRLAKKRDLPGIF